MLITLRLTLSNGEQRLFSQEIVDADETPRETLERVAKDGRIPLGDRESCRLDEIVEAEVVVPEPQSAPTWMEVDGLRLRDEDVSAAMESGSEIPPG